MTTLGKELLQAVSEARAIARGEADPSTYRVFVPSDLDVASIRKRLKMTQVQFANTFGLPLTTLRDWEQGRVRPDSAARSYLLVISRNPEAVEQALHAA
jgi:putative transcriptional regulator